jgi:uncharacterized protein (TIGR03083 family)
VNYESHCTALRREGRALTVAARTAGVGAPVPSCPEWTVADLLGHVGRLHRWIAAIVDSGGDSPSDHWSDAEPPPAEDRIEWFDGGVDIVTDVLLRVEPATPAWSWTTDATAGFWARRQANETAIHRWDAQTAAGATEGVDPSLAVDGVDEFFGLIPFWKGHGALNGAGESIHLHATDVEGEWSVRLGADGVIVTNDHADADVALRAPASDLLLFLYGRAGPSVGETAGDVSLLERWQALVQW